MASSGIDVLIDESYVGNGIENNNVTLYLNNLGFTSADLVSSSPYKFLTNNSIYREDGRLSSFNSGDDWFESADARQRVFGQS